LTGVGDGCYDSPPLEEAALAEVIASYMHRRMLDHQEIEWQFEAADLESVESWLEQHPPISGLAFVPGATRELSDTYYDTEDWRLYRAGCVLRVRRDGEGVEATIKSLAPAEGALRRRREISVPLRSDAAETLKEVPGPVGELLRNLAGDRDLRPLFEIRTRRRPFALHPERSSEKNVAVGELTLDESEISGAGKAPARLSRVEIEADSDTALHEVIEELVDGLRDALNLRPTETSKFETGLSAAGLSPPKESNLGPKERSEPFGEKDDR
jgi:inorganic triphosphatase YgiF